MESISAEQLNFWMVELGATLAKQFNLDRSQLEQVLQKSAKDLGIYKLNTIKTSVERNKVTREQVESWFKPPAKGGLKIADLKQKAVELGVDPKLKKEDLRDNLLKKVSGEQITVQSTTAQKAGLMVICRHNGVKSWVVKNTHFVVKSPKERWVVGKIEGERVVELTFKDRAICHANGWPLEKGSVIATEEEETVIVAEPVAQEYQVLDIEEEIEQELEEEEEAPEDDGSDID